MFAQAVQLVEHRLCNSVLTMRLYRPIMAAAWFAASSEEFSCSREETPRKLQCSPLRHPIDYAKRQLMDTAVARYNFESCIAFERFAKVLFVNDVVGPNLLVEMLTRPASILGHAAFPRNGIRSAHEKTQKSTTRWSWKALNPSNMMQ